MEAFQDGVRMWMGECFPPAVADDRTERCDRFIEEALELTQACGYGADRAHALVDYVFARPSGEPGQEVGGTLVTLAALCSTFNIAMGVAARRELDRIREPETMQRIRAKQAAKPTGSALPIAMSQANCSAPGHTDLMLAPEDIDAWLEANPPQLEPAVRPEVAAFAVLMERELQANEHKGGWKNDTAVELFATLLREVGKLEIAVLKLMKDGVRDLEANRAAVITEAADVANMAMMTADVVGGLRPAQAEGTAA